jgi:hypothetical protein
MVSKAGWENDLRMAAMDATSSKMQPNWTWLQKLFGRLSQAIMTF